VAAFGIRETQPGPRGMKDLRKRAPPWRCTVSWDPAPPSIPAAHAMERQGRLREAGYMLRREGYKAENGPE